MTEVLVGMWLVPVGFLVFMVSATSALGDGPKWTPSEARWAVAALLVWPLFVSYHALKQAWLGVTWLASDLVADKPRRDNVKATYRDAAKSTDERGSR